MCSEDILRRPDLNTVVAFDRFVETLNGHDTVGIIFQNIIQHGDTMPVTLPTAIEIANIARNVTIPSNISESTLTTQRNRKRQAFDEIAFDICPFPKKMKNLESA